MSALRVDCPWRPVIAQKSRPNASAPPGGGGGGHGLDDHLAWTRCRILTRRGTGRILIALGAGSPFRALAGRADAEATVTPRILSAARHPAC